jgi:hypothetical protein
MRSIHAVINKMFHKGPVATAMACQKWHSKAYFIFGYFSTKLGGSEKERIN